MSVEDTALELFEAGVPVEESTAPAGVEAGFGCVVVVGVGAGEDGFPSFGFPFTFAAGVLPEEKDDTAEEGCPQVFLPMGRVHPVLALHLETQEPKSLLHGAPKVPCKEAIARNAIRNKDGMIAVRRERVEE
jgi:hypothetical protein